MLFFVGGGAGDGGVGGAGWGGACGWCDAVDFVGARDVLWVCTGEAFGEGQT